MNFPLAQRKATPRAATTVECLATRAIAAMEAGEGIEVLSRFKAVFEAPGFPHRFDVGDERGPFEPSSGAAPRVDGATAVVRSCEVSSSARG